MLISSPFQSVDKARANVWRGASEHRSPVCVSPSLLNLAFKILAALMATNSNFCLLARMILLKSLPGLCFVLGFLWGFSASLVIKLITSKSWRVEGRHNTLTGVSFGNSIIHDCRSTVGSRTEVPWLSHPEGIMRRENGHAFPVSLVAWSTSDVAVAVFNAFSKVTTKSNNRALKPERNNTQGDCLNMKFTARRNVTIDMLSNWQPLHFRTTFPSVFWNISDCDDWALWRVLRPRVPPWVWQEGRTRQSSPPRFSGGHGSWHIRHSPLRGGSPLCVEWGLSGAFFKCDRWGSQHLRIPAC